jgi:hypothetical protein
MNFQFSEDQLAIRDAITKRLPTFHHGTLTATLRNQA